MNHLIEEYHNFENEVRGMLECQYNAYVVQNNMVEAYETLGKLMAYKLIPFDDPRIEKNNRSLAKYGISSDHRFRLDYRKDKGFMPDWLFGNLIGTGVFQVSTISHRGIRSEMGYIGYTSFGSYMLSIRASLCQSSFMASKAIKRILSNYNKETKKTMKEEPLMTLAKEGVCRIYTFTCESNCINSYKDLGDAVVIADDSGISVKLVPNYESMIGLWVPIEETCESMIRTVENLVKVDYSKFGIKFQIIPSLKAAVNRQADACYKASQID